MRKLASIQLISELRPIEGRDRIELAIVQGWSVIVQKGQFKVGDKCVFIEPDSLLPEIPAFEFMRQKGFRVKTMKMAGVISQGICFPIMALLPIKSDGSPYEEGEDVTDVIGIRKYNPDEDEEVNDAESNESAAFRASRKYPRWLMRMKWFRKMVLPKKPKDSDGFPSFISKTDETRVQNIPHILERNQEWVVTEKIDGQSATYVIVRHRSKVPFLKDRFDFIVCSRNKRVVIPDASSYWDIANRYAIKEHLMGMISRTDDWLAIQGEIIGPKIQGNKYNRTVNEFYVFNVITQDGRFDSYFARAYAGLLPFVPILGTCRLPNTIEEILSYAHGTSRLCDVDREGLVFRSLDGKESFKAVDPLFLIKHNE